MHVERPKGRGGRTRILKGLSGLGSKGLSGLELKGLSGLALKGVPGLENTLCAIVWRYKSYFAGPGDIAGPVAVITPPAMGLNGGRPFTVAAPLGRV